MGVQAGISASVFLFCSFSANFEDVLRNKYRVNLFFF